MLPGGAKIFFRLFLLFKQCIEILTSSGYKIELEEVKNSKNILNKTMK